MEVQCPQCQSRFNLPDAAVRPNVKLRCSVCQHVFRYGATPEAQMPPAAPAPEVASPPIPEAHTMPAAGDGENLDGFSLDGPGTASSAGEASSAKKKSKLIISILVVLLCIGCGAGAWWYMNTQQESPQAETQETAESVKRLTILNLRQYYVKNEKIGYIFVVQGAILNEDTAAKDLIEVEAAIYSADKAVLSSKEQLAGTTLSRFQLQVLDKEELEAIMHNEIEILTKNTNVPTGGEVPFMVIFYDPPAEVAEFGVKILKAKDAKKEGE